MKTVFLTSTACAGVSLLGLIGLSAMTVVPGGEGWHRGMMLGVALLFVAWAVLAAWAWRRSRRAPGKAFPVTAKTAVITVGVIYVLLVLLSTVA